MTLADIKNEIYRRTKTNSTSFPAADMLIEVNLANQRVHSLIRQWFDGFLPTDWTSSDLSTGTASPVFDALFHELIVLWVVYRYTDDNKLASRISEEIQLKEQELVRFYGLRNYKTFSVTIASPGVFTRVKHGLQSGDKVILATSGALPTGLSVSTVYYVITSGLTDDAFELATSKDGTAITTTGTQSGTHFFSALKVPRLSSNIGSCR